MFRFYCISHFFILLFCAPVFAQDSQVCFDEISKVEALATSNQKPLIQSRNSRFYQVDLNKIYDLLNGGDTVIGITLPNAAGLWVDYKATINTTMEAGLQVKFPEIISMNLMAENRRGTYGKLNISPNGLHAMIFEAGKTTFFIDPLFAHSNVVIAYKKTEYETDKQFSCNVSDSEAFDEPVSKQMIPYNSCVLRTYRIAIAATGEYTQFQGGQVSDALAAMVVTMNRVNGVYERDFGVTMTMVANTDTIVFTEPDTDPYSNGSPGPMLGENQTTIDNLIGSSNYDIGHVFGTNSGGIAALSSTCSDGFKAEGVTGSSAPIGDSFDIDYVAHELGHQFGARHSFNNSCNFNRNNNTAMEPGSGSTIMAYAGICAPNVQNNSDDHFHGVSMREIGIQIQQDNCPILSENGNSAPVINDFSNSFVIPASTPFALTAVATDLDQNDVLTYNWEQMDNEISEQPPITESPNGPNFRSFTPDTLPTRYFPKLSSIGFQNSTTWEMLPSVSRELNFRVSIRDNAPGAGCTQYQNSSISVSALAGPFTVLYPSSNGVFWGAFSQETMSWDVANTAGEPINAQTVQILLSTNSGLSYDTILASNVINNGSFSIEVPNISTTQARIMVMNSEGTFFDVSNSDFTITGISDAFVLQTDNTSFSSCVGSNFDLDISVLGVGNFSDPVTLSVQSNPEASEVMLTEMILSAGESTVVSVTNTAALDPGVYDIVIVGNAGDLTDTLVYSIALNSPDPQSPALLFPQDNGTNLQTELLLDWADSVSPDALYDLQVSTLEDFSILTFSEVLLSESEFFVQGLSSSTTYLWRVRIVGSCGNSAFSDPISFSTLECFESVSTDVPVPISALEGSYNSEVEVPFSGIVADVNVINVFGTHSRTGDLVFTLISPQETEVTLAANFCGSDDDFQIGFDDDSQFMVINCPATDGATYQPVSALSDFIGEPMAGVWTLQIEDQQFGGGGMLESWTLEICSANITSGISTAHLDDLRIYPNPVEDWVTFDWRKDFDARELTLLDVNGRQLMTKIITGGSRTSLSMQHLASGVYLVKVQGESGVFATKLIKY